MGASVSWLGLVAALAVRLAAQGRIVPQLKKVRRRYRPEDADGNGSNGPGPAGAAAAGGEHASYVVRWAPALVESDVVSSLAEALPGAAAAFENQRDPSAFTQAALADIVDAIATEAAERLDAPAPPPAPRTRADVAETALARLDGAPFVVPARFGSDLSRRLDQWARPVTEPYERRLRLIVSLDPPDDIGAWHLSVLSESSAGELQPVERALVIASRTRRQTVKHQMARLERLFPELVRLGGRRRGEVILNADEAWQLMTTTGHVLQAVGYDVRVPALSRRRPTPSLRLTSVEAQDAVVGARQLADVRWSVAFDDVELTAAEIRDLATQARPLVKSRGRWVELDRADLNEAAAALAERADTTRMSGADMLRHALGLEGSPLAGGTMIAGQGWAAELISSARHIPDELPTKPEGFSGALRTYQADALVWLGFLEQAGLGGCLALDMGLGKTPTMLAHIRLTQDRGPSLVAAPPAVVGNWAAEARRFVPGLKVVVHHGPGRTPADRVPAMVERADLVVSTYGTVMRDLDVLEKVQWSTVVLDEAQAIKNPASETAQQLRRLEARTRVALTGTPIENGLGDLWAIMDFCNPGLLGARNRFIAEMSKATKSNGSSPDGDGADGEQASNGAGLPASGQAAASPKAPAAGEGALAALNGLLVFRRTKAEPAIAAELPDRIDELDHCTMTAEQIGLYQAVLDELVARTESTAEGGPRAQGSGAGRHHRPQAGLQPPGELLRRRGPAGGAVGQAGPAGTDHGPGVRRGGADADLHPLRHLGGAPGRLSERAHRPADQLLPRRAGQGRPRPPGAVVPERAGRGRAGAVAEGGRHRPEPHRGQPRGALRPLVEPGRRGPGPRPGLAHRAAQHGGVPPAGVPGHGGRAGRGGGGGQAPHRRRGAAQVLVGGRPRQRPAPDRAGHRPRLAASGRERRQRRGLVTANGSPSGGDTP